MKMNRSIFFVLVFLSFSVSVIPCFGQENVPAVVKKVDPSIVVILTYDKEGKAIGQGTGFFIDEKGDVITSRHVLQGADRAAVKAGEKLFTVTKVLAEDTQGDLMRISIDIPGELVHALPLSPSFPEAGERVVVIGTPFGLEKTVSDGIVSAIREIPEFGKIIQVTAPISPGSSGSPVVNMKGEVIGVATFFLVSGQNLNFAIPAERISGLVVGEGRPLSERVEAKMEDWLASAEGLYATGLRYLWVDEYEKALLLFLETVKKDANHGEAYFQIGYCLGKLGRYQDAAKAYAKAIEVKPDDVDAYNNLCVAYGLLGQYDEAVTACKQAALLKIDSAEALNNLCWSYQRVGHYEEAIVSCKGALRINPDFALAHYNLGNNYSSLGKYGEAIESYKQAIRIKFDYAEAHSNLGAAYNQTSHYEEAIESYRQAIRIKPDLAEAHLDLGMTYLKTGDRGSAIEEYKTLKNLDQDMANKLFNLIYE